MKIGHHNSPVVIKIVTTSRPAVCYMAQIFDFGIRDALNYHEIFRIITEISEH